MGVTIGGDSTKGVNNSHMLVIMRMRIPEKVGLLDLSNIPTKTK